MATPSRPYLSNGKMLESSMLTPRLKNHHSISAINQLPPDNLVEGGLVGSGEAMVAAAVVPEMEVLGVVAEARE
ncbi:MAG: hypothetical protein M1834_003388 [Cirrosporium novae-zelandiae]|nr:MAG: hypothetical protein M1834_003388 [Cirrosporium novae-zelandiae]